ncbi:GGDEF domain-containing protein [Rheinheimera riviphila]|uniref:diguanylate cyclase n=1 Tax=Rheinheimera riviphila TaxID=1834037 RepID=A0A437QFR3_9GAMM|nr:GGDEF domain-containing protein [Rheinheimera riviphila]RVU33383.1 GGDEF domain-containing protein [Rheinheimera riviphila]
MKKLLTLLSVVLLFVAVPSSAEPSLDSLFDRADKARTSNPSELQILLKQISKHKLTENQQQYYYYLLGSQTQVIGDHDEAIRLYQQALITGNSVDLQYRTLLLLSNVMTVKQNMTAAFSYLFQASELVDKVSNPELKPSVKVQAIITYMTLKLYQETIDTSQELLDTGVQGLSRCNALFYNNYSTQELTPEKIELSQIQNGINYCKSHNLPIMALYGQVLVAKYHLFHKEFEKAESVLNFHKRAAEDIGPVHLVGHYYVTLSQAQYFLNDTVTASKTLDNFFKIKNISFSSEPMVNGLKLKAEIEEKLGNTSTALKFYKQYIEADKIFKNTISLQQTAYNLAKNEIINKNQQIALLEKSNTLLTLENELATVENDNKKLFITLLLTILMVLGYFAFRAFRNTRIYRKIAENDSLVGISNRYYFTKVVALLLSSSKTTSQTDAFIIFDLDWFKQVNDLYGHLTGDWVLKAVVSHCRQFVRNVDIFGRIGGEEFAIFLPACTAEKAALLAEILRDAIEEIDCNGSGYPIKITASFGVTCSDRSGYELRQLFRDADIALYLSKNQGRNKVTLFEPTQQKESATAVL